MAWIESHQELSRHPKTKKLSRLLGVSLPAAVGHLHFLWWWALDYAQDGDLSRYDNYDIADACGWDGDPKQIVDALIESGFLDEEEAGLVIHDWFEYAGRLVEKREQNKERKRKSRQRAKMSQESHEDVTRPSRGQVDDGDEGHRATEPNQTIPNHNNNSSSTTRECEENKVAQKAAEQTNTPITYVCETINEAHTKVFGTTFIQPMYGDLYTELLNKGRSTEYVIELILEAGESTPKPPVRYIREIDENWQAKGIKNREEAKKFRKPKSGVSPPKDKYVEARNREIAFNRWIDAGGDPDEFVYLPTGSS